MHVVAVTGMPGAGKGVVADVAQRRGWPVIRMGDLVREETRRRGLPEDPKHVAATASDLREEQGPGAWAHVLVPRLRALAEAGHVDVLVDGVRNADEVAVLRRELGDEFLLVAVVASEDVRHTRLMERGRGDDVAERAWLRGRDERELGYGLGGVIEMADHALPNEDGLDEFRARVEELFEAIGAGGDA